MLKRLLVAIGIAALSGCGGTLQNRNGAEMLTAADVSDDAAFVVLSAGALASRVATKRIAAFTGYAVGAPQ
ncbi:MAG TPA: hypothetical protein VGQ22_09340 [Steroidobacteraceae bacterium]|jgi:hypothetical protein|nr:hypothetical protein [Steroidobacteraceae bacterium]